MGDNGGPDPPLSPILKTHSPVRRENHFNYISDRILKQLIICLPGSPK